MKMNVRVGGKGAPVVDECCICGLVGPLTYEHIPPEAAFNDQRVLQTDLRKVMKAGVLEYLANPSGTIKQRGFGAFTLCASCNSNTGAWYAPAYVDLAHRIIPIARALSAYDQTTIFLSEFRFHAFLKQILTMFCSANGPSFAKDCPEIPRYLLNRDSKDFPAGISIYMALYDLNASNASRQAGLTGRLDSIQPSPQAHVYSEISYMPFNLVLSVDGGTPDKRLSDITWFREFEVRSKRFAYLSLYSLPVNTYFPADYRTLDEVRANRETNRARRKGPTNDD